MTESPSGFLRTPPHSEGAQALFDDDLATVGFVMNASRMWAYEPHTVEELFGLIKKGVDAHGITFRQRGIMISACAGAINDSYCSLMWGNRLAGVADPQLASAVLTGADTGLTDSEQVLARWARTVARDANSTTAADVQDMRDAGFDDAQIFGFTVFIALRVAFSTINDALGARPDAQLRDTVPAPVLDVVSYGRPMAEA